MIGAVIMLFRKMIAASVSKNQIHYSLCHIWFFVLKMSVSEIIFLYILNT